MWSSLLKTWTPVIVIKNAFSSLNADGDDIRTIRRTTQKGKAFKTKITWLCFYALLVWKVIVLIARLHRPAIFGKAHVGHWYRYDSPDSGVQTMSFFFLHLQHDADTTLTQHVTFFTGHTWVILVILQKIPDFDR